MRRPFPSLVAFVLLAATSALLVPARAADLSVVAGRSRTSLHLWTTVVFVNVAADKTYSWHALHVRPVGTLGWVKGRDIYIPGKAVLRGGQTVREPGLQYRNDVFVGGAGLRLVDWFHGAFFSFQFGIAAGRTSALSSSEQFISSLGWQGRHWVVMLRHISNGDFFPGDNRGESMIMAGIRF